MKEALALARKPQSPSTPSPPDCWHPPPLNVIKLNVDGPMNTKRWYGLVSALLPVIIWSAFWECGLFPLWALLPHKPLRHWNFVKL
ncbi:hypothetical protein RHMOL_Rhmol01G0152300 [Rhododendron molle]|uniref:Uncharacterized protein n=1 Tax=Rhododendron molle TaxID=49168 RepID=A0ACC0Q3B0_RHOML|nr:hypothetical protein RHMOL_Rhmol01G0152300 [Rhododendron molle]